MYNNGWEFTGEEGSFRLKNPHRTSYLYFPLVNEAGMMSSVTPLLHGQMTSGHNSFLSEPVSVEQLHQSRSARNFWVNIEHQGPWSVTGNSARQYADLFSGEEETSELEAGFLWHKLSRINPSAGLRAEVTSFVPVTEDKVELMKIKLTNIGSKSIRMTPTAAVPIYGRSADDLRDHRHVTSLLHRMYVNEYGVEVQPVLSFDERGHRVNKVSYFVLGGQGDGCRPSGFFPVSETFVGEGGLLDWPEAVVENRKPEAVAGDYAEGFEAMGGIRFGELILAPGESQSYILAMGMSEDRISPKEWAARYLSEERFEEQLKRCISWWNAKLETVVFQTGTTHFDLWMKWVTLQPILRRLYGNSFLPYHDYGRGGRGWRDLWQDCLALMVMEPAEVRSLLFNNYAGVRVDGSNATIIGTKPGEFIADRNNIPRVWMDHGAWPLQTTLFYIHQSGDLAFLEQEQTYFRDSFVKRCREKDEAWTPGQGNQLRTPEGHIYRGTILEHVLLQNLVPFFHVGEHNVIRLEGADWNDGLDLAPDRGESTAFTSFYAGNLVQIAEMLRELQRTRGTNVIEIAEEMVVLLDTLHHPISYSDVMAKRALLDGYFESVRNSVSGKKAALDVEAVISDLERKAESLIAHLRKQEWTSSREGYSWFNGYYNNDGIRVEGDHPNGVRMTLTGQVFAIMYGVADDEQVKEMIRSVDRYLRDEDIGYRLNSSFGEIQQNLGRAFGFAFGHKENGAMFSHMTVMYANALYQRGFAKEGWRVLDSVYGLSRNFETSRMYPGIPEYINAKGRGMYPYLTGSASWLLLTMITEVFGVKGRLGELRLTPKLMPEQFDQGGTASITTSFAGKRLRVTYGNPEQLPYGSYGITSVRLNGTLLTCEGRSRAVEISRALLQNLDSDSCHELRVELASLAEDHD